MFFAHFPYFSASRAVAPWQVDDSLSVHSHLMLTQHSCATCRWPCSNNSAASASAARSSHSPSTEMGDDFSTTDSCQGLISVVAEASRVLPLHGTGPLSQCAGPLSLSAWESLSEKVLTQPPLPQERACTSDKKQTWEGTLGLVQYFKGSSCKMHLLHPVVRSKRQEKLHLCLFSCLNVISICSIYCANMAVCPKVSFLPAS